MSTVKPPTAEDWAALQAHVATYMSAEFQSVLREPPSQELAEQRLLGAIGSLVVARRALSEAVASYIEVADVVVLWPEVCAQVQRMLQGLAHGLGVAAAMRGTRPELGGVLLREVDDVCEVWGRLVRNLAGGLMYVMQESADPMILRQFVLQAAGISGVRPTALPNGGLRVDASPEPAEKLALFFGV